MKRFIKRNRLIFYSFLFLLVLSIFIYRRWISFSIFTAGDWQYFFSDTYKTFPFSFSWFNLNDLGVSNIIIWRSVLATGQSFFSIYGFGSNIAEKILIFWPTLIFGNLFSFLLVKKVLKSNLGAITGAIVFNYNTYYIAASSAFLLYSAAPWALLSLYFCIKALESRKIIHGLLAALSLFVAGLYDFRVAYIGAFCIFLYFIYSLLILYKARLSKVIFKYFLLFSSVFITFGLLNIFWILPMIKMGSLTDNSVLSRGLFGNEFLNINYALTLFHPFWTGGETTWFSVQPIMIYFWLIPLTAFFGLFLNKGNKNVLFFGLISLVGIFLTKQVGQPFSDVYPWLNSHLVGFSAFREASKFYYLIAMGYSVLIASFITYLFSNCKKLSTPIKSIILIGVIFLFLWNVKPIITGEISGVFIPRQIPKDYLILRSQLLKDPAYFRTLWIPTISTWGFYTSRHPELNMGEMLKYYAYWHNQTAQVSSYGRQMIKVLNLPLSNSLLDLSSVKYVVLPLRDVKNDGDTFIFFGENRDFYARQLAKIPWLSRVNLGTSEVAIYENNNFKPHIYTTSHKESIKENYPIFYNATYAFVNPTEYRIVVKNVKGPFYLNFSESYHPDWRIRVGSFNWWDTLMTKNYFVPDSNHFKNDAGLNSYRIDPKIICHNFTCQKNSDGSHDISMTLYFTPQSYVFVGSVVSITTLLGVLGYLSSVLVKRLKR